MHGFGCRALRSTRWAIQGKNRQIAVERAKAESGHLQLDFVDLCAGLGGFHLALKKAGQASRKRRRNLLPKDWEYRCVMAAELLPELRELYVQNFSGIEAVYQHLYPPNLCAAVPGLDDLYVAGKLRRVHGDLAQLVDLDSNSLRTWPGARDPIVPKHDLLCAGFPCQPFSKSGAQLGFEDLNGTVFHMLVVIIAEHQPPFVLLENVGNFERHDHGNTWNVVREWLQKLNYDVRATTTVSGQGKGFGLLSPHHLGLPQHRERFFIVAQHKQRAGAFPAEFHPFPRPFRTYRNPERRLARMEVRSEEALRSILARTSASGCAVELAAARVSSDRVRCIDHWCELLSRIAAHDETATMKGVPTFCPLPSFPIWGYELDPWQHYPVDRNPSTLIGRYKLLAAYRHRLLRRIRARSWWKPRLEPQGARSFLAATRVQAELVDRWVQTWPAYASRRGSWPHWKRRFILQNRDWAEVLWERLDGAWLRDWLERLYRMPPSHQKLEWNCHGESDLNLWKHILQFRPSGLRVKRFRHVPALVAMTTTQIPIIPLHDCRNDNGHAGRHIIRSEALQLQGFPARWKSPKAKRAAFEAFGNAVHVELVAQLALAWLHAQPLVLDTPPRKQPSAPQPDNVGLKTQSGERFDPRLAIATSSSRMAETTWRT